MSNELHLQKGIAVSDGGFWQKRSKRLQPTKEKAVSDGGFRKKYQNWLHPHTNIVASDGDFRKKRQMSSILTEKKQYPMETFEQKSPNRLHPTRKSHKKDGEQQIKGA